MILRGDIVSSAAPGLQTSTRCRVDASVRPYKMTNGTRSLVQSLASSIDETLSSLTVGLTKLALLDYPDHGNVGDSAIYLGEIDYFRRNGLEVGCTATTHMADLDAISCFAPDEPIFLHGGGNFGDIWPAHHQFRETILERFRDRPVVQLPQSIHFSDPLNMERTARLIEKHGRVTILVRDASSLALARSAFSCEVRLCPDMAFAMEPFRRPLPADYDVMMLLRSDTEARDDRDAGGWAASDDMLVADWLDDEPNLRRRLRFANALATLARGGFSRSARSIGMNEAMARARLDRGCRLLSRGRTVVTDRLHGHILCLMMEIPHVVVDNSYGKLTSFIDRWTSAASGVAVASSIPEALELAAGQARKTSRAESA